MRRASVLIVAAAVVGLGIAAWPFTVDDAFIVARYAHNLAHGGGWAMNPGTPTDGVTGPLWVLPLALASALGLDPVVVAKGLGLACAAAAAALAVASVGRRQGGEVAAPVAAAVLAVQGTLAWWGVAGLGTGLSALLLLGAILGATGRPRARPVWTGACLAALAWLRPELAAAGAVLVAALLWRDRRAGVVALTVAVAGVIAVVALRLALFGHPLPLSFSAKPADPGQGLPYVARGLVVLTGVLGGAGAAVAVWRGRRGDRVIGLVVLAHLLAIVVAGGDWMPGFRMLVPVLPPYAMLVGVGTAYLWRTRDRWRRALAIAAVVAACTVPILDVFAQLPAIRAAGAHREDEGRALAVWLGAHADRVALVDVGFIPWASGVEVIDLAGLTDPQVARAQGGHVAKRIDPGWLAAREPDAIVLHSAVEPRVDAEGRLETLAGFPVERAVAAMPWVREQYAVERVVRYAPEYFYVVLTPRKAGVPRPTSSRPR